MGRKHYSHSLWQNCGLFLQTVFNMLTTLNQNELQMLTTLCEKADPI